MHEQTRCWNQPRRVLQSAIFLLQPVFVFAGNNNIFLLGSTFLEVLFCYNHSKFLLPSFCFLLPPSFFYFWHPSLIFFVGSIFLLEPLHFFVTRVFDLCYHHLRFCYCPVFRIFFAGCILFTFEPPQICYHCLCFLLLVYLSFATIPFFIFLCCIHFLLEPAIFFVGTGVFVSYYLIYKRRQR